MPILKFNNYGVDKSCMVWYGLSMFEIIHDVIVSVALIALAFAGLFNNEATNARFRIIDLKLDYIIRTIKEEKNNEN